MSKCRKASPEFLKRFKGRIHALKNDEQLHEKLYIKNNCSPNLQNPSCFPLHKPKVPKRDRLISNEEKIISGSTTLVTPVSTDADTKVELNQPPKNQKLYQKLKENMKFVHEMSGPSDCGIKSGRNSIDPYYIGSSRGPSNKFSLSTKKNYEISQKFSNVSLNNSTVSTNNAMRRYSKKKETGRTDPFKREYINPSSTRHMKALRPKRNRKLSNEHSLEIRSVNSHVMSLHSSPKAGAGMENLHIPDIRSAAQIVLESTKKRKYKKQELMNKYALL